MATRVSRITSALLAGSIVFLVGYSAHAELQEPATDGPEIGDVLEEVIVTAQRRSELLERTPVAISAISGESLQRAAATTDAELQTVVPGLLVKAGAATNQLNYAIRGQSLDAFSGVLPGVLPYFNEVQVAGGGPTTLYDLQSVQALKGPQGTLFGRNSTGGTVLFTSNKAIDEFGGYISVAAGNHAMYRGEGALNVPLLDGKVLTRLAAFYQDSDGYQYDRFHDVELGGLRRNGVRGSVTLKITDNLTNDLVVDYVNMKGTSISSVIYSIYPTGSTNAPAPANFLFTPAMEAVFGVGAWATYVAAHPRVDPGGIVSFAQSQKDRGPYRVSVSSLPFVQSNNLVVSNITTFRLGPNTELKNIVGYTNLRNRTGMDFDGSPYIVDERGAQGGNNHTEQKSEEAQILGLALSQKLNYVVGIYLNEEETVETTLSQVFGLEPFLPVTNQINSGKTERNSYAIYGQGTYDLSDVTSLSGLSFTVGGRYTHEEVSLEHLPGDVFLLNPQPGYETPQTDTFEKFSWIVGFEEQLNPELLLYLHARSSARNGGFNFFAAPLPGFGNDGGSEYKAETATDVEFGAKYKGDLGGRPTRANLAIYDLKVKDAQRATYVTLFGSPAAVTVNVPETRIRGIEFDGAISLATWLMLGGSVNFTDAEFTENQVSVLGGAPVTFGPVPDISEWSGTAYVEASATVGASLRASVRLDAYAQSSFSFSSTGDSENPGTMLPGYGLLNLRLGLDDPEAGWSVAGVVKNVFDRTYYVGGLGFGSLFTYNLAVPGATRTYELNLRYAF